MKLKRIIFNFAVIVLAFIVFAIWYQNNMKKTIQTSLSNIRFYEVYLITTDKGLEYWEVLNRGASDMAAAVGIRYFWEAPEERSIDQQIQIINNAVESGAEAILVAADDPKWLSGVIEDAKARGVKVIYVDSPAYEEAITTLATDNYNAGIKAGETMLSILDRMGIDSGSVGIINLEAKENTRLRETGFRDVLSQDGRFRVLETLYTSSDRPEITRDAAEQIINDNEDLIALFGPSEGTSIGIGYANQANNNQYVAIGFDKTSITTKLLNSGSLRVIIDQNPYTMGYLGMAQAIAAILGKDTGPEFIDTGISVLEGNMEASKLSGE